MQSLEDLIPHQLKLTVPQMAKLLQGLTALIPHSSLGADKGDQIIHLLKGNAEKMMKAYKAGTGVKVKMSKKEIAHTLKRGRGFEDVFNSPVAQKVVDKIIDKGIDRLLGGDLLGDLGMVATKIAENPKTQQVAEKVVERGIEKLLGFGARPKKGSAEMKERMAKLRALRGKGMRGGTAASDKAYEALLGVQKGLRTIGKPFEATIGVNPADIGEPIGQAIGETFRDDIRGFLGLGEGVGSSRPYRKAMKSLTGSTPPVPSTSNAPVSKFSVDRRVRPSSTEMTLSPYQVPSAPAMNPFVPKHYTQEGGTQSGYGGRGLY